MTTADPDVTVTVTIPAHYARRLSALVDPDAGMPDLEAVIFELIDHAQQGITRPGSWERSWLRQVFGGDFERPVAREDDDG